MASADLRDELDCSICLNTYTDPVTLRCGHNFCQVCIDHVLDTQEGLGLYTCPECREEFQDRPVLRKNTTLSNIAELLLLTLPEQDVTVISCTYCDFFVPAVKTCVQCETSMCDKHLMKHNKSVEHTLISPETSLGNRACTTHHKFLAYYCCVDSVCVCAKCISAGHSGHQVESLDEASERKKEKLRNILGKMTSNKEDIEKQVQSLQDFRKEVQAKAGNVTARVTALFRDIRRQLEDLEKRVRSEISRQEEKVSLEVSEMIQQLEVKKDQLFRKMCHIEELFNMTDPVTVLQEQESDRDDFYEKDVKKAHFVGDLEEGVILKEIYTGLSGIIASIKKEISNQAPTAVLLEVITADNSFSDIITDVDRDICVQKPTEIFLDVNTASNNILISDDFKSAYWSKINQNRPETPERFEYPQVLTTMSFSSGRHYWEVETSASGGWRVGLCYPSMDKKGDLSYIGDNNLSWCLRCHNNIYSVIHDNIELQLSQKTCQRLRMCLDYEAGQLSFFELCNPIRHLHTYSATYTEPLYVGFRLYKAWVRVLI